MCRATAIWRHFAIGLLLLGLGMAGPAAAVEYQLGPLTELLDPAFYAGEAIDGSDVAGRMAFFGQASNDGKTAAFMGTNMDTLLSAVFLVDIGEPDSWRRLTVDVAVNPTIALCWTLDDLYVIAGEFRIPVATGEMIGHEVHGFVFAGQEKTVTRLPADNWLSTYAPPATHYGDIMLLPILANADEDLTRQPVVVTNILPTGPKFDWPRLSKDGSMLTAMEYTSQGPTLPDHGDIYVVRDVDEILAASREDYGYGAWISTLAPDSLEDPYIVPIRADETDNFAAAPFFSQDNSLVLYSEDFNNVFQSADFFTTFAAADFDVMISNADGTGDDVRMAAAGNQMVTGVTPGGCRILYMADSGGAVHLYVTTLEVVTEVSGTDLGNNDIETTEDQQASDASGTEIEIPTGTVIDFPDGEPQEIQITTPIDPATEPELPPEVDALPVVRDFGPEDTTFTPAITVQITYTDEEIEGLDEANLRVYLYNDVSGVYDIEVTDDITNRDLVNNTISFTVDHFSSYGLGAAKDTDGDGLANPVDPDDDNDGIPDGSDAMPLDTDNDGIDNEDDPDDDGDGVPDAGDAFLFDTDNDGTPNATDTDDDGDGIDDATDAMPYDSDNDGQDNDVDTDDDNDGVPDDFEMWMYPAWDDFDGDGVPNWLDDDSDNDGLADGEEYQGDENWDDWDDDGQPNYIDLDSDGDGLTDQEESQGDSDWDDYDDDGQPNFVDLDSDNDGLTDQEEAEEYGTGPYNEDSDGDGVDDGTEVAQGYDPLDDWSGPGVPLSWPPMAAALLLAGVFGVARNNKRRSQ